VASRWSRDQLADRRAWLVTAGPHRESHQRAWRRHPDSQGCRFGAKHGQHSGGFAWQPTLAGRQHDGRVRYWLGEGESARRRHHGLVPGGASL